MSRLEKVAQVLSTAKSPMTLSEIAVKAGMSAQLTQYHLRRLVKDGFVLLAIGEEDEMERYLPQPLFINQIFFDKAAAMAKALQTYVEKHGVWTECANPDDAIKLCIRLLLDSA